MSDTDMYRVVLTRADGMQIPTLRRTRDDALAYFGGALAASPIAEGVRLRVISERTWLDSVDAALAAGWEQVADNMEAGRWKP